MEHQAEELVEVEAALAAVVREQRHHALQLLLLPAAGTTRARECCRVSCSESAALVTHHGHPIKDPSWRGRAEHACSSTHISMTGASTPTVEDGRGGGGGGECQGAERISGLGAPGRSVYR